MRRKRTFQSRAECWWHALPPQLVWTLPPSHDSSSRRGCHGSRCAQRLRLPVSQGPGRALGLTSCGHPASWLPSGVMLLAARQPCWSASLTVLPGPPWWVIVCCFCVAETMVAPCLQLSSVFLPGLRVGGWLAAPGLFPRPPTSSSLTSCTCSSPWLPDLLRPVSSSGRSLNLSPLGIPWG